MRKEKWKTIIDFTKIKKGGIEIKKLIRILSNLKNDKHKRNKT